MFTIETSGSWGEMGEQMGEAFSCELEECMHTFTPWLVADLARYRPAIRELSQLLQALCPQLVEESEGLARGADIATDLMLGYRFFNEIRSWLSEGCSVIYLADSEDGPLLGRNSDLSPGFEADVQLRRICRPNDGVARIQTGYLGLAGSIGLNAHGLAIGGASAHTPADYGEDGLPAQALLFVVMGQCQSVADARAFMACHVFRGKSLNLIAGDVSGESVLFEMPPGRTALAWDRVAGHDWQLCTNFFLSGEIPISPEVDYLESAYARYGRMTHCLMSNQTKRSVAGLKSLLTDVAQPGLCDSGRGGVVKTAYSQVMELKNGRMHLTPGHPAETAWETISL
jgi:predicted choloylglycine hydrolase